MNKSEEEFKKELSPELYHVAREKGTEAPFTGKYYNSHEKGMYTCAVCGNELFSSDTKFDSKTGWPSFSEPVNEANVDMRPDSSYAMERMEVVCKKCGSHLGHVFDDGPTSMPDGTKASGKRYCINSVCLKLEKENKK